MRILGHPFVQRSIAASSAPSYVTNSDGVERCDLYIRLEHFQTDAQPLFAHLGFELTLPRANESARPRDWRSFYTSETVAIVENISAIEIERFEYSFNDLPLTQS